MKPLGKREMELLHRVANGETYVQIARTWGVEEVTARTTGVRVLRKLEANTIAHAVHLAHQAGLLRRERHGDHAGFVAHIRHGEPPCDACVEGELDYQAERARIKRQQRAQTRQAATDQQRNAA